MRVLNIHGYKGTPHNAAYSALCGFTKNIISPEIDYDIDKPEVILNRLLDICAAEKIDMIVGTSGFFASVIAARLHTPLLLVNPCLQPQKVITVLGYEGNVSWFEKMSAELEKLDMEYVRCIIGNKDEIIGDHAYTKKLLGMERITVIPGGMHSGATLNLEKHFSDGMFRFEKRK